MLCAVCFGDPTSPQTQGYQYGILTLLVIITLVLFCFGSLFWKMRNRIKKQHL